MGQMNFRKQSYTDSSSAQPAQRHPQPIQLPTAEESTVREPSPSKKQTSSNNLPRQEAAASATASTVSVSHSYYSKTTARSHENKSEPKTNNSNIVKPKRNNKEFDEQANVANANEVSTEDIVVPPPESFGNDDNHRALAAAAASSQVKHNRNDIYIHQFYIAYHINHNTFTNVTYSD